MAYSSYTAEEVINGALTWGKYMVDKKKYRYETYYRGLKCPICHPGASHGWQCIGFVTACYYHGGGLRSFQCGPGGMGDNAFGNSEPSTKKFCDHNGPGWVRVTDKRLHATQANMKKYCQPGDVIIEYTSSSGKTYHHNAIYWKYNKSKKKSEFIHSGGGLISITTYTYPWIHVYRFVGPGSSKDKKPYTNENVKVPVPKVVQDAGLMKISKSTCAKDVRKGAVALAKQIAKDNRFHYGHGDGAHHNGCYFCNSGSNRKGKAKDKAGIKNYKYTFCCNPFVNACFAHGGGDPGALKLCKQGKSRGFKENDVGGYEWASKNTGDWKRLDPKSIDDLIAGDVMCSNSHVKLYIGNKQVAHASSEDDNKSGSKSWNNSICISTCKSIGSFRCYRYIGKGGEYMCKLSNGSDDTKSDKNEYTDGEIDPNAELVDDGSAIVLEKEVSQLLSSQNYEYLTHEEEEKEQEEQTKFRADIYKSLVNNLNQADSIITTTGAVLEGPATVAGLTLSSVDYQANKPALMKAANKGSLMSFPTYVEAPTIVLDFNGIRIGGYGNRGDYYPNYISNMTVNKVNGRINNYTFTLSYQVRPGEDPNFIDKLIARTVYRNPLKVLYGDSMYEGGYFRDEELVITDARHSEDISAYKINYTIQAISSVGVTPTAFSSFGARTDKPSTAIYDLLYGQGQASQTLLTMFPGMQDRTAVSSAGLIPTNDRVIDLSSMNNASPLTYLSYATACMSNESGEKSSYFLTYSDTSNNSLGGAYFKITEVSKTGNTSNTVATVYSIDVGYPSDNNVLGFQINTSEYWSLVYETAGDLSTWQYGIDDNGQITADKVNLLTRNDIYGKQNIINTKWWDDVTEYPISAKLVLKGLVTPAILMSYIDVNVYFYGQKDMTSGLYVVTAQQDSISSSGYTTELTLLRVSS